MSDREIGHAGPYKTGMPSSPSSTCDHHALNLLFPQVELKRGVEFKLEELVCHVVRNGAAFDVHNPQQIQNLVDTLHQQSGAVYSYGGWLEDRGTVFAATYMAREERYIHLGIDVNLPAGTEVCLPVTGMVRMSISDDQEIGWGARVDLSLPNSPYTLLLGHLDPKSLTAPSHHPVPAGTVIGTLGAPPLNGNVFPHLHIQAVRQEVYEREPMLDGYGMRSELERLPVDFPNPFELLCSTATLFRG